MSSYDRVYNFSAGPACLPVPVLEQVRDEMLNWNKTGMSVMECSHRSPAFEKLLKDTLHKVRSILGVPDNYTVFFPSGGATLQFSAVPLNLCYKNKKACYITTGVWSRKALEEAKRMGVECTEIKGDNVHIPEIKVGDIPSDAAYVYICDNETINGVQFHTLPKIPKDVPLVADMSSSLFSRKLDISKYGLIYACAQKNFGPAGTSVVIIRDDLIPPVHPEHCPILLSYKCMAGESKDCTGMYNTPPCFPIYVVSKVLDWIEKEGGLEAIEKRNNEKAKILYDFFDSSKFWVTVADKACRSTMNIPFKCARADITQDEVAKFLAARKLMTLKGHRMIPNSFRASIYTSFPVEGVRALVEGLKAFEASKQ